MLRVRFLRKQTLRGRPWVHQVNWGMFMEQPLSESWKQDGWREWLCGSGVATGPWLFHGAR